VAGTADDAAVAVAVATGNVAAGDAPDFLPNWPMAVPAAIPIVKIDTKIANPIARNSA